MPTLAEKEQSYGELLTRLDRFADGLEEHGRDLGLTEEQTAEFLAARDGFAKMVSQADPPYAGAAVRRRKWQAYLSMEGMLREMGRQLVQHRRMSEPLREAMGIKAKPPVEPRPEEVTEAPDLHVVSPSPGELEVHFGRIPWKPEFNSMPKWATACYIYRRKAGEKKFEFLLSVRESPFVDQVDGPASDYAYVGRYMLHYRGVQLGPESKPASAR